MKYNLLGLILLVTVVPAHALTHKSVLGFSFELDNNWTAFSKNDASSANKDKTLAKLATMGVDEKRGEHVLKSLGQGDIEFIFDHKNSTKDFINNISIQKSIGVTARTAEQATIACKSIKPELDALYKKNIDVVRCGIKTINGISFMSYAYSGVIKNSITLQNEFQVSPAVTFVTVAASLSTNNDHVQKAQNDIATAITRFMKASPDYFAAMSKAIKFRNEKQYKKSYQQFKILTRINDPESFYNLAQYNEYGKGTGQDDKTALKYYTKSAQLGHTPSISKVAEFHLKGRATKKNPELAARLFFQAGKLGDPAAQNIFATLLYNGIGVKKADPDTAIKWFTQAANQGYEPAAVNLISIYEGEIKNKNFRAYHGLALLYLQGIGVKQDTKKAIEYLEKAAFDGVTESRKVLYEVYSKGLFGVPKNDEKANVWK